MLGQRPLILLRAGPVGWTLAAERISLGTARWPMSLEHEPGAPWNSHDPAAPNPTESPGLGLRHCAGGLRDDLARGPARLARDRDRGGGGGVLGEHAHLAPGRHGLPGVRARPGR